MITKIDGLALKKKKSKVLLCNVCYDLCKNEEKSKRTHLIAYLCFQRERTVWLEEGIRKNILTICSFGILNHRNVFI